MGSETSIQSKLRGIVWLPNAGPCNDNLPNSMGGTEFNRNRRHLNQHLSKFGTPAARQPFQTFWLANYGSLTINHPAVTSSHNHGSGK